MQVPGHQTGRLSTSADAEIVYDLLITEWTLLTIILANGNLTCVHVGPASLQPVVHGVSV